MAQEFAPKLPKGIPTKCDQCGSLPKAEDVVVVDISMGGHYPDEPYLVYHVRCYNCGLEWVD